MSSPWMRLDASPATLRSCRTTLRLILRLTTEGERLSRDLSRIQRPAPQKEAPGERGAHGGFGYGRELDASYKAFRNTCSQVLQIAQASAIRHCRRRGEQPRRD